MAGERSELPIPEKLLPVFIDQPGEEVRYRCAYGGRGSGKTRSFALLTAVQGYRIASRGETGAILCVREYMNSLKDSSFEEVKRAIMEQPFLAEAYAIGRDYIRTRDGRMQFIFSGMNRNIDSIKSKSRILVAWADEADSIPEAGWRKLLPTVREEGSEVWVTWNPERDGSATDIRFKKRTPDHAKVAEINWRDNPFFTRPLELQRREDLQILDPATYNHVWEGAYLSNAQSQVFANKFRIEEFEPKPDEWGGPYQGLDYGFSKDPAAGVRCWIDPANNRLYIEYEAGGVGVDLDNLPAVLAEIPDFERYKARADSARPESTSHLNRHGFPRIESVKKWSGSVEDGVAFIRSFREVIIHPRCKETRREFELYSFKVDRLTGEVTAGLVDAYNHYIDAIRYALEPLIKRREYVKKIDLGVAM